MYTTTTKHHQSLWRTILPGILTIYLATAVPLTAVADDLLTGTVIGTTTSFDYTTSKKSTIVNTREMAFDGNLETFFASWDLSYTWTGLDLGQPHVITRVGWSPRDDADGPKRVLLGVFEGANREDFMDALPLYIIDEEGTVGQMSYADVTCSAGFRYVRYVGPSEARCDIAELEFYGHEGTGDSLHLYQLTNLPTVTIHTKNGVIPKDKVNDIAAQLTIIGDGGTSLLSEPGGIRERGNGSRTFPKRPYRIKFDNKQRPLDAPAKAKKWTLINNYGDKTLLRNLLAFELSRCMDMPYTPYGTSVDVLLNGEYKGNYQLCDQVQVHKKRVNIEEMTPQDNSGKELTGGYLIEIDAYATQEPVWFTSINQNPVTIKSPSSDSITDEQAIYIEDCFNQMEQKWKRILDTKTFLRHFLVGELSGNTDTYWSVYMYKQRANDTIYTGPVWDFDLAFENDKRTYPVAKKTDYVYRSGGYYAGNMVNFVNKIIDYIDSRNLMRRIWASAREDRLNEAHLLPYIDSLEASLQQSQRLNFLRWPIMNQKVHQNPVIHGSYEAEVENVRQFLKKHLVWMDNKMSYTFGIDSQYELADIDYSRPYDVFSISGQRCDGPIDQLGEGVYIIRQEQRTRKMAVGRR